MKGISILTYFQNAHTHLYEVPLGNGTLHCFKSLRETKAFLAATNQHLNSLVFQLNETLIALHYYHRSLWMLSESPHYDREVKAHVDNYAHHLEKAIVTSTHSRAGNYYAFINLRKSIQAAKELIKLFSSTYAVAKVNTMDRKRLEGLFVQVLECETSLQTYGQMQAFKVINIAVHENINSYERLFKTA